MIAEPVFTAISRRGTLSLPPQIRRAFHLDTPGAQVEITVRDGVIELRPCLPVPADQLWYWTPENQERERQADLESEGGLGVVYGTDEAFLASLRSV
jgi:bifunctional DNA-binding transcriptional regulator/antitoxin component of YhaV-PrlF toxin-antitoxin module